MPTVKETIEWLEKNFRDADVIAYAVWMPENVQYVAMCHGIELGQAEAEAILESVHHGQSGATGITWDVIEQRILHK